jgi:hypothetical protein
LWVVFLSVLVFRRPDQFLAPYIWVEDGTINLPDFLAHGWSFVAHPIVGYISLPIRVIFGLATSLSFRWLPEIAFVLAMLFAFGIVAAVACSPTALRHRFLCATAMLVIPTNPEVFGVSLYTGWWGSVLALLPLLWPADATDSLKWRAVLLFVGGLSTPIAVGLLPLYVIRFLRWRNRVDAWLLALCLGVGAVQSTAMLTSGTLTGHLAPGGLAPLAIVTKFFGHFVFWSVRRDASVAYPIAGLALLGLIAVSAWQRRHHLGWTFAAGSACLVIVIALSIVRGPLNAMDAVLAGGRYFFLPYIMLSWLLLYLVDRRYPISSALCIAVLVSSAITFVSHGRWHHAWIDWRTQVRLCMDSPQRSIPVLYEGTQPHHIVWQVTLSGRDCRRLVRSSLFDDQIDGWRHDSLRRRTEVGIDVLPAAAFVESRDTSVEK